MIYINTPNPTELISMKRLSLSLFIYDKSNKESRRLGAIINSTLYVNVKNNIIIKGTFVKNYFLQGFEIEKASKLNI